MYPIKWTAGVFKTLQNRQWIFETLYFGHIEFSIICGALPHAPRFTALVSREAVMGYQKLVLSEIWGTHYKHRFRRCFLCFLHLSLKDAPPLRVKNTFR